MKLVLDTGVFLLLSQLTLGRPRSLAALARQSAANRFQLVMSLLAFMECASHVLHARASLPYMAWEYSSELRALRDLRRGISIDQPGAEAIISATVHLRRLGRIAQRPRSEPTLVDAMTAELVE